VAELLDEEKLEWNAAELSELNQQLEREPGIFVLRHRARELGAQRYLEPGERERRRGLNLALDQVLWRSHRGFGLSSGYTLFVPGNADCRLYELPSGAGQVAPGSAIPVARKLKHRLDVLGGRAPALEDGGCSNCADELRLNIVLDAATAQLQLRARSASDTRSLGPPQPLTSGTNFFAWEAPAGAREVWAELALAPEPAGPGKATLGPITHRRCPLPAGAGAVARQ
jgi:hypothetical protein